MGLINFIFCTIGKCFEIICLLSELNFIIVHSLIRLIVGSITFLHNLPMLLTSSVVECWNFTLVCLFTLSEGVSILSHNVAGGGQQLLGGVLESCKMVGYLTSHVFLRTKDFLHRGLLSGHSLLKHMWEGCGIAISLIVYLTNTIVNLLLIGTQNLYTVLFSLLETAMFPLQNIAELTFAMLSFLYSSLVGASVFLWTPCLMIVESLASLGHILSNIFLLNVYGLLFTAGIVMSTAIYMNPELTRRYTHRLALYMNTVPSLRRLRRALQRLFVMERNFRQSLVRHGSRIRLGMPTVGTNGHGDTGQRQVLAARRAVDEDGDAGDNELEVEGQDQVPLEPPPEGHAPAERVLPSSSTCRPLHTLTVQDGSDAGKPSTLSSSAPDSTLLNLLQEQEERKKCVICQDSFKTVVLLPCRHLCLCRECTDILLSQPVYQRNCPLCRHMIFQTMDVYL